MDAFLLDIDGELEANLVDGRRAEHTARAAVESDAAHGAVRRS
ncbi:MAG: hypothetical protein AAF355_12480 [Myxococcota bacterium]